MSRIYYGRQNIDKEDIKEVLNVLRSDFLTQGPKIEEFENEFSKIIGSKYSLAVCNGTAALHLSLMALGLEENDRVITTPLTFSATANSVLYCRAEVVFSDINPETYLLDFDKVKALIESKPKGYFKGIIPVNFAGKAVNLEMFYQLAKKHELWILEDSCHAPGAFFIDSKNKKQNCGNGVYSNASIFSFHPVKHITSGEGGMITTNDKKLFEKLKLLRSHGIVRNPKNFQNKKLISKYFKNNKAPNWYMEMVDLGFNYRMSDITAALGISQLKKLKYFITSRHKLAKRYIKELNKIKNIKTLKGLNNEHALHLFIIEAERRDELYEFLMQNGIICQIHYIPIHMMPYYSRLGWNFGDFPLVEKYFETCMTLPLYPGLKIKDQDYIISLITKFYEN